VRLTSTADIVVVYDAGGVVTDCNEPAAAYSDIPRPHHRSPVAQIIPLHLRSEHRALTQRLLDSPQVTMVDTLRLARDGSEVPVRVSVYPIRNAAGRVVALCEVGHIRDADSKRTSLCWRPWHSRHIAVARNVHNSKAFVASSRATASCSMSIRRHSMRPALRLPMSPGGQCGTRTGGHTPRRRSSESAPCCSRLCRARLCTRTGGAHEGRCAADHRLVFSPLRNAAGSVVAVVASAST